MSSGQAVTSGQSTTALVLMGGGITGFVYEVGCLAALDEWLPEGTRSTDFPLVVGTSAGSALAALVSSGVEPSQLAELIREADHSPLDFRREDIYDLDWSRIAGTLARGITRLPKIVRNYFRPERRASPLDFLIDIQTEAPAGLFSNLAYESYVRRVFELRGMPMRFRDLPPERDLIVTATDLDRGEAFIFSRTTTPEAEIPRAITASSAVPMFFTPVEYEDRALVDGAVSSASNIELAIQAGARLVIIVNPLVPLRNDRSLVCLPAARGKCASMMDMGFAAIGNQTFRLLTDSHFRTDLERTRLKYPDVQILVFEPTGEEAILLMSSPMAYGAREHVLRTAYETTRARLETNGDVLRDTINAYRGPESESGVPKS